MPIRASINRNNSSQYIDRQGQKGKLVGSGCNTPWTANGRIHRAQWIVCHATPINNSDALLGGDHFLPEPITPARTGANPQMLNWHNSDVDLLKLLD